MGQHHVLAGRVEPVADEPGVVEPVRHRLHGGLVQHAEGLQTIPDRMRDRGDGTSGAEDLAGARIHPDAHPVGCGEVGGTFACGFDSFLPDDVGDFP